MTARFWRNERGTLLTLPRSFRGEPVPQDPKDEPAGCRRRGYGGRGGRGQ